MSEHCDIAVVLPAFNEELCIETTLNNLYEELRIIGLSFEIIVVDDGSTDSTVQKVIALQDEISDLRLHRLDRNYGIGKAIREGVNAAKASFVLYTDADLPVSLKHLKEFFFMINNKKLDAVFGVRKQRNEGRMRFIYTVGYNFIVRVLFGYSVYDINCPFKMVRSDCLRQINLKSKGPFIDAEMVLLFLKKGFKCSFLPVKAEARIAGLSHFASFDTIAKTVFLMLKGMIIFMMNKNK